MQKQDQRIVGAWRQWLRFEQAIIQRMSGGFFVDTRFEPFEQAGIDGLGIGASASQGRRREEPKRRHEARAGQREILHGSFYRPGSSRSSRDCVADSLSALQGGEGRGGKRDNTWVTLRDRTWVTLLVVIVRSSCREG